MDLYKELVYGLGYAVCPVENMQHFKKLRDLCMPKNKNDFTYFRDICSLEEQNKILTTLENINSLNDIDKPYFIKLLEI